jgi:hypothetical protein
MGPDESFLLAVLLGFFQKVGVASSTMEGLTGRLRKTHLI